MRSEVREAMAAADLELERRAVLASAEAEQKADAEQLEKWRRRGGLIGVLVFGLLVVFCVNALAAMANAGQKADAGFWVILLSLPVNSMWLGKCWRMVTRDGSDD